MKARDFDERTLTGKPKKVKSPEEYCISEMRRAISLNDFVCLFIILYCIVLGQVVHGGEKLF